MTTYNTGNPIGSKDPRDLYDNAENLDEAVNSSADTFQDRLGKSRLTWSGIQAAGTGDTSIAVDAAARAESAAGQAEDDADRAASAASRAENAEAVVDATNIKSYVTRAETARDAAFVNADVYPDVATGRAAVTDGEQFQVVEGDEIVRYRKDSSSTQTEVARYPSAGALSKNNPKRQTIQIGGLTEYYLSEQEAQNDLLFFSGSLAEDCTVIFPKQWGKWTVRHQASGGRAINLVLEASASTPVRLLNQQFVEVVSNNVNLYLVDNHYAPLDSPIFTGNPEVPPVNADDRSNRIPTASFVHTVARSIIDIDVTARPDAITTVQAGFSTIRLVGSLDADLTLDIPTGTGIFTFTVINETTGGHSVWFKGEIQNPSNRREVEPGRAVDLFFRSGVVWRMPYRETPDLPIATTSDLGTIRVGAGLTVDSQGTLSADGSTGGVQRTLTSKSVTMSESSSTLSPRIMLQDGMVCCTAVARYLRVSYDYGETWEDDPIADFGQGPINWVKDSGDGELVCCHRDTAVTPNTHTIYKSKGWNGRSVDSWHPVHSIQKEGVSLHGDWGWSQYKNFMLCAEYGAKTGVPYSGLPDGAEPGMYARFVYMSKDFGETWETIFDLDDFTDGEGVHMHGVLFDEYWNRIWVSHGDGVYGSNGLYYSDDLGKTWTSALETQGPGRNYAQTVHMVSMPTCILLGSDSSPNGIHRISRSQGKFPAQGYYDIDTNAYLIPNQEAGKLNHLCHSVSKPTHLPDMPVVFGFGAEVRAGYSTVVATFDGWSFFEVWIDSEINSSGRGVRNVIGPTYENEIIITCYDENRPDPWYEARVTVEVN